MKSLFKLFKNLGKTEMFMLIGVFIFVVGQVWLDLKMPDYTANLTTAVSSGTITTSDVWTNGGLMLLCALGSMICSFICSFFTVKIGSSFSARTRAKLFNKIQSFSDIEIKKFSIPSLITRSTNDITRVQMFVAMGFQVIIKAPILAIWAICKISSTSVEWTLATIITVIIMVVCVGLIVLLCLPKFKKIQNLIDNLNNVTRENITGVRVVRAFNAENYQENKFEKANKELTKNQMFTTKTLGIMMPVMTLCISGLTLAIYWIGAYLMDATAITEKAVVIGNMTAFTQYALSVVMAFMLMVVVFVLLPRTLVSAKRISEVLETEVVISDGKNNGNQDIVGEIEFKNVGFKYHDGNENILNNISFTAKKGETIAIIGATGSGKTTMLDLILRNYDVSSGEILVDGVNVKDYSETALQNKISMINQKPILFKGTIKDNIAYGSEVDEDKVEKALNLAEANFVNNLEKGIDSEVSQGGSNFSGGQKQRLSIARAIYKDAEIMIFDDSFSALDYKTDMQLRKNIKENLDEKTIIIVAQRIGTIKNADKILVLDKGQIVGEGTHQELLDSCQVYKEIALSQLSKEELENAKV